MIHIVEHYVVKLLLEEYFKWRKKKLSQEDEKRKIVP